MKFKLKILKALSGALRKKGQPHTWEDTSGYNIGDTKDFPDGSQRVLGYAPSGVRRWLSTSEAQAQGIKAGEQQAGINEEDKIYTEQYPDKITVEEWESFNKYLIEDNPFLQCVTYGQMETTWFSNAYDYDNRIKELEKPSDNIESADREQTIKELKKKQTILDNYFLAVQMYKISCLIYEINQWNPEFDYKKFIKGKTWGEMLEYFEEIKQPGEVDYTKLYQDEFQELENDYQP